jgi:peptidoglycan/xylan/chitin deacetylase (PgdA/CDA1 family)
MSLKLYLYRKKEALKKRIRREKNGFCNVLLYHRVNDLEYDPQQLCVSIKNFEAQLSTLKKDHVFIGIEEFCHILEHNKRFPRRCLMITFDDGYADNYYNALPVLESLNLQALFYIATATINTSELFWWDELDLVFKNSQGQPAMNELVEKHKAGNIRQLYAYYVDACKMAGSLEQRERLLAEIRLAGSPAMDQVKHYRSLTDDELIRMSASRSAVIGAHTVNHLALGCLTEKDQYSEISESVQQLENKLKNSIRHFSFPYGEKKHYSSLTVKACRELGLKSAAANYYDYATPNDDLFSFPRVVVRNDSAAVLQTKLKALTS